MPNNSLTISVGPNLGVRLTANDNLALFPSEGKTKQFLGEGPIVLDLAVSRGRIQPFSDQGIQFDSGGLWRVFKEDDRYIFVNRSRQLMYPNSVTKVDFQTGCGEVFLSDSVDFQLYPFEYPLDEVIFSKLLADRNSVIVHACGVSFKGFGMLFPGHSGAGKSTLCNLLSQYPGFKILSDDRVVVSVQKEGIIIYGTPWLGSAGFALPESAPLSRILFLQHDSANRIETMSAIDATTQIIGLSVLPYWDTGSVEKAIDAAAHSVEQIPTARFGFVPDGSSVECLFNAVEFDHR